MLIECNCGCKNIIENVDKIGRPRRYLRGHSKINSSRFKKGHIAHNKDKHHLSGIKRHEYNYEFRKKLSKSLKGKNIGNTNGFKKGQIPWNKGKMKSIDLRIKQSLKLTGEKVFNGFKSLLNKRIRNHPKFIEWRNKVFEKNKYICQNENCECCNNEQGVKLNAHHIIFLNELIKNNNIKTLESSIKCDSLWDIDNGITFCEKYHLSSKIHKGGD